MTSLHSPGTGFGRPSTVYHRWGAPALHCHCSGCGRRHDL